LEIIEVDCDWQYPAITEQHAFNRIKSLGILNEAVCYVAFPWATYIDRLKNGKESEHLLEILKAKLIKIDITKYKKIITVCQHIRMLEISDLINQLGITDVFWSHKVKDQNSKGKLKLHPFPLFPTQVSNNVVPPTKDILYSFVGARSNQWYLTNIRELIIDRVENKADVIIKGRDKWHYNDIVYKKQVQGIELEKELLAESDANAKEYLDIMNRSKFALCPSGSGPNSIRLWECVEMGIIPVLLADTYAPPKSLGIFEACVVTVEESDKGVQSLDKLLRQISEDECQQMLKQLLALKLLYGKENFIYDVVQLVMNTHVDTFLDTICMFPRLLAISLSSKILLGEIKDKDKIQRYTPFIFENIQDTEKNAINTLQAVCKLKGINFEK
jgi:hypothetical protein